MAYEAAFVRVFDGDPDRGGKLKGTAFFIHHQQLLTAKHVVDACTNGVYLRLPPHGDPVPIHEKRIIRSERDVASLRLNTPATHADIIPVPINSEPLEIQHDVVLHGFFHTSQSLETRSTHISGYVNTQHTWRTSLSVKQGMSGGAVLRDGVLVGIIQARDEEHLMTYVIPVDAICECLENMNAISIHNSPTYKYKRALTELHNEFKEISTENKIYFERRILDAWLKEVGI